MVLSRYPADTTNLCRYRGSKEKSRPPLLIRGKTCHPDFQRSVKGTFAAMVDRANRRFFAKLLEFFNTDDRIDLATALQRSLSIASASSNFSNGIGPVIRI